MSLTDTLRRLDVDDALDLAGGALDAIERVVDHAHLRDAALILRAVRQLIHAVSSAAEDRITPDQARIELQKILRGIEDNDAAADAAVDARFGDGYDGS